MREAVQESETFVDFFAQIVMGLFKDEGLLVIDSGVPRITLFGKGNYLFHKLNKLLD